MIKFNAEHINYHFRKYAAVIIILYAVGLAGMIAAPIIFAKLSWLILLINLVFALAACSDLNKQLLKGMVLIAVLGFASEVVGIKTGKIFGNYYYGESLGIKINNVPLIIAANWLLLAICSHAVTVRLNISNDVLFSFVAAAMMTGLDFLIEQVAARLDYWYFTDNLAGIQNYIAWYVLSFVFQLILKTLGMNAKNRIGEIIFTAQVVFFIVLNFTLSKF